MNRDPVPPPAGVVLAAGTSSRMGGRNKLLVEVEGEPTVEIDGLGLRDHSWGPRYWQAIHRYRWLTINFAPDFGMMVSTVYQDESNRTQGGVVIRGEKLDRIVGVDIDTTFDDTGLFHKDLVAHLKLDTGEQLDVSGKVMSFIPLRNRREGMVTHVGEGMTAVSPGPISARQIWLKPSFEPMQAMISSSGFSRAPYRFQYRLATSRRRLPMPLETE